MPHPEDGRAWFLRLTARGKRLAASVDASSAAHFDVVLARLDDHPSVIIDALTRLAGAMRPPADKED